MPPKRVQAGRIFRSYVSQGQPQRTHQESISSRGGHSGAKMSGGDTNVLLPTSAFDLR